jgi:hypothetical protein
MSKNYWSNHWMGAALVGLLFLSSDWPASAQSVTYAYDPAGNTLGAATGAPGAPVIIASPQPALMNSNSSASFSVDAAGSGLTYQWFSNSVAVVGATGDSFVVANEPLTSTNLGSFFVVISNAYGAVTSAPVALWSDLNHNGVPDWWEMKYFGNLNQPALGDYDGDGVDNLDEYLEGTDPTNPKSFDPRLYIQAAHGNVMVSPDLPYYTMGQLVTLTAIPDPGQEFVEWSGAVKGTKSSIVLLMNTNESVTATFGFPLGVALDNTNLIWTTSGDEIWFGQAEVSEDGIGAAQSGPIVSYWNGGNFVGDQTTLQTTFYIAQPGQFGFWWDVSSQPPDGVTFSINGKAVASLSGQSVPWQQFQTNLSAGLYTLVWTYSKGPVDIPNGIPYSDAAWVDQVTLTAATSLAPLLGIQTAPGNAVLLYWPEFSAVLQLQQTAELLPANWINTTNSVNLVNGTNQVLVEPAGQSQFYRLVSP